MSMEVPFNVSHLAISTASSISFVGLTISIDDTVASVLWAIPRRVERLCGFDIVNGTRRLQQLTQEKRSGGGRWIPIEKNGTLKLNWNDCLGSPGWWMRYKTIDWERADGQWSERWDSGGGRGLFYITNSCSNLIYPERKLPIIMLPFPPRHIWFLVEGHSLKN